MDNTKATLVERLRSRAVPVSISGVEQSDSIFTEAADEIESSHREVHALSLLIEAHVKDEKELLAEIECLRAENERMGELVDAYVHGMALGDDRHRKNCSICAIIEGKQNGDLR